MQSKTIRQVVRSRYAVVGPRPAVAPLPTTDYRRPATAYRLRATAFTLVELLVALALVAAIVTMVYGSYTAATRALDSYGSRMACRDRASLVLRLLARQLRCAYVPSLGIDPAAARPNSTSASATRAPRVEPFGTGGDTLRFTTTADQGIGTGLVRVRYRLEPLGGTLSLCSEPYVYDANSLPEAQNWRPLLNNVRRLEVEFYDGRQWLSGFTAGPAQELPQAARITLSLADGKGRPQEFKTTVPLGCRRAASSRPTTTALQGQEDSHAEL